jgi:mannose-6-phosphate isomerase-like protein (cupin superfamily)
MKRKKIFFIILIALILFFVFRRIILINTAFMLYDIYSLNGLYWKTIPEYCSPMKYGFRPVMPLEFYADFNNAIFERIPTGNNLLNRDKIIQICDRNLKWLNENAKICEQPTPIEILYVNDSDFERKVMFYLLNDHPFVMRGINLKCFETMKFDKLMEKVGNNKVYMSPSQEKSCPDNVFTEFNNIVKNKCYITNSTNLFYYYHDLLPDDDMKIIGKNINNFMSNDSKQLFVGVTKGSGTALHAAYTNNFFIMIEGEKRWTFFNPNQLALLYPNFQKKGIYMASESRFLNMNMGNEMENIKYNFPLIKYAERYEVDIKEGDILYNPKSWFHSVYNKTEISVACSTRWSNPYNSIPDRFMLRYGHMINPELRNYVKDIYIKTGVLGISQIDEHKHMIGENNPDAIPFWDKYTNDTHKLCKNENCSKHWHDL